MNLLPLIFTYGIVEALAQESGVFGFGPSAKGVLLKLDVSSGNSTVFSSQAANNSLLASEAARIHPTFKSLQRTVKEIVNTNTRMHGHGTHKCTYNFSL